jgi:hypothetical protein
MANSDQEPQKDLPSSSDIIKDNSQCINPQANKQGLKLENSRKVQFQPSEKEGELRAPHSKD